MTGPVLQILKSLGGEVRRPVSRPDVVVVDAAVGSSPNRRTFARTLLATAACATRSRNALTQRHVQRRAREGYPAAEGGALLSPGCSLNRSKTPHDASAKDLVTCFGFPTLYVTHLPFGVTIGSDDYINEDLSVYS